jgi:hypothetical protein
MTVRVDTLDALIGSSSRLVPLLRTLSEAISEHLRNASERIRKWWQRPSALVMSDEWLHEFRWSNRDRF